MVELSHKEKDHCTYAFLEWFVNEQVQEETKFETILQKFDLLGRDKLGINEVDKFLEMLLKQVTLPLLSLELFSKITNTILFPIISTS